MKKVLYGTVALAVLASSFASADVPSKTDIAAEMATRTAAIEATSNGIEAGLNRMDATVDRVAEQAFNSTLEIADIRKELREMRDQLAALPTADSVVADMIAEATAAIEAQEAERVADIAAAEKAARDAAAAEKKAAAEARAAMLEQARVDYINAVVMAAGLNANDTAVFREKLEERSAGAGVVSFATRVLGRLDMDAQAATLADQYMSAFDQ